MGRLLKEFLGDLRVKDCRIDWVRESSTVVSYYYRATHRPTGTVVQQRGPESWNWLGRRRLLLRLRAAVEEKQR